MIYNLELNDSEKYDPWFHLIRLKDGRYTPSRNHAKCRNECMDLWGWKPEFFHEKRVLDVGCRDGLHTLIAEECGAKEIVSIDVVEKPNMRWIIDHFDSIAEYHVMNICDKEKMEGLGKFDTVIFCGVFYHLIDPLLAVFNIKEILNDGGNLLFESLSFPNNELKMTFIPETHPVNPQDHTNWWIPSDSFLISFFRKCGFQLYDGFGYGTGPYSNRWHCNMIKSVYNK